MELSVQCMLQADGGLFVFFGGIRNSSDPSQREEVEQGKESACGFLVEMPWAKFQSSS